jgi:hypothetical protein
VLVLGLYIEWATRQRQRVPGWIGWILLAWALPFVTALPASPGWALAVSGGLIVVVPANGGADRTPGWWLNRLPPGWTDEFPPPQGS